MIKTHTQIIPAPIKGLNYPVSGDELSELDMSDCRNVSVQDGLIQKRHGYKLFGTNLPLSGAIMGFDQYKKMSGATYLLCMTTKDIYRWDSSNSEWDVITENTLLDDCEDNPVLWQAAANVTVSRETTDIKAGSAAVKISPAAGFTTGQLAYREKSFGDISTYNHIRLWVKSSVALSAGDLQLVINEAGKYSSLSIDVADSITVDDSAYADIDRMGILATEKINVTDSVSMSITPVNVLTVSVADSIKVKDGVITDTPLRTLDLPALSADTWSLVLLDLRVLGLTTDLTDVGSVSLKAATDFGAADILIDEMRAYDCFTGDDDDYFEFDHIRKFTQSDLWWCCTNGVNYIKRYDGNSIVNLSADAPLADIVRQFKTYLFAMRTVESGNPMNQRARWPNTAEPDNWLTGNASYRDLSGSDWIMQALRYKGDYLVVLKEKSLWLGYASLDTDIFKFDNKVPEIGCASGKSALCLGEQIIFLGWEDVYVFDGIEAEAIGARIRKNLFEILKTEQIGRAFGCEVDDEKEYWLFVVSSSSDYPDMAWNLNRDYKCWTRHDFADYMTTYGHYYIEDALKIGDLTMQIKDMTWKVGDRRLLSQTPTLLFGDKDGYTYEYSPVEANDNDTAIDAYFDTRDFVIADMEARMRIVRLDVYYKGPSLDVYYSLDKGVSWTLLKTLGNSTSLETPNIIRFRINTRQIRWRFRNSQSDETFFYQKSVMHYQRAGERLLA